MSCGIGWTGLDPALLWCRPAATALNRLLAWELPYATGAAPKKRKKKEEKKRAYQYEQCSRNWEASFQISEEFYLRELWACQGRLEEKIEESEVS